MSIATNLKHWRQVRGYTQPILAERAGIEQSYLSKLENSRSIASEQILDRLAEALEIDCDTLLKDPTRNGNVKRLITVGAASILLLALGFTAGYLIQNYEVREVSSEQQRLTAIWSLAPEDIHIQSIDKMGNNFRSIYGSFENPASVRLFAEQLIEHSVFGDEVQSIHLDADDHTFMIRFTGALRRPVSLDNAASSDQRDRGSSDNADDSKS